MTFDAAAFADTAHRVRADLEHVATAVGWLAPTAYEQRAGGSGHTVICGTCDGAGRHCVMEDGKCVTTDTETCRCAPERRRANCNDCVVATLGDVGEIVVRRHDVARLLDEWARDLDRVWDTVKGMHGRVRKLEAIIDRGATLEGIGPPTVDPHEVAQLVKAREARVKRGEALPPEAHVAADAKSTLKSAISTQEKINEAKARNDASGRGGNRWRR